MKKLFFNKEQEMIHVPAKEFISMKGMIKVDPYSNVRTSDFKDWTGDTEDLLKKSASHTVKNNKDGKALKDAILKSGYDCAKQSITVVPLSEYLKGLHNKTNLQRVYSEDRDFVATVQQVLSILDKQHLTIKEREDLLSSTKKYFVVVGGNTRVSLIRECYYSDPDTFNTDGSMETLVPVNVVDLNSLQLVANNCLTKTQDFDLKDNYDLSILAQIVWNSMVYADNRLSSARNIPLPVLMMSKGYIGRLMIDGATLSFDMNKDLNALQIIKSFNEILKRVGIGMSEMDEALMYYNIYNYFKNVADQVGLPKRWAEELPFVVKVLRTSMTARLDSSDYQKEFCKKVGLDFSTLEVDNEKLLVDFFNYCVEQHNALKQAGSYLGKPLRDYLQKHIDSKRLSRITNSTWEQAKEHAAKEYQKMADERDIKKILEEWLATAENNKSKSIRVSSKDLKTILKSVNSKGGNDDE